MKYISILIFILSIEVVFMIGSLVLADLSQFDYLRVLGLLILGTIVLGICYTIFYGEKNGSSK